MTNTKIRTIAIMVSFFSLDLAFRVIMAPLLLTCRSVMFLNWKIDIILGEQWLTKDIRHFNYTLTVAIPKYSSPII